NHNGPALDWARRRRGMELPVRLATADPLREGGGGHVVRNALPAGTDRLDAQSDEVPAAGVALLPGVAPGVHDVYRADALNVDALLTQRTMLPARAVEPLLVISTTLPLLWKLIADVLDFMSKPLILGQGPDEADNGLRISRRSRSDHRRHSLCIGDGGPL